MVVASNHFEPDNFEAQDDRNGVDDDKICLSSEDSEYDNSDDDDDDEDIGEEELEGNAVDAK